MESMIEKLFRETGRTIDRRQFVQGDLALAATASAVSLPTEAAARQGIKTTWVSHYTYVAPDMKKTRDWYHEVFGMQMGYEDRNEAHLWYGATGGDTLMIVRQARAGEGAPRLERFAFMVDPWDGNTVQAALRRRGARHEPTPITRASGSTIRMETRSASLPKITSSGRWLPPPRPRCGRR